MKSIGKQYQRSLEELTDRNKLTFNRVCSIFGIDFLLKTGREDHPTWPSLSSRTIDSPTSSENNWKYRETT